ncbi:zinc finger CCHC domain-containing protein 8 [Melitaea cinxia]|uniref:zinc finger CCHC domain-containing protein 8 n=1 Tax=Melitaea cinxia TaxID=113334 RepID=UPI001E272BB0|nr:zinc finger CCHC domain-containing protein 8 [Melitaea cinxia]
MAKRKAGVNDIIFELDNDDIVISSDDEVKEPKKSRSSVGNSEKTCENKNINEQKCDDVISIDSFEDSLTENKNRNNTSNGEKITSEWIPKKSSPNEKSESNDIEIKQSETIHCQNNDSSCVNTVTIDEDIVLDSPASNSGFAVIGCENRTPLISLRFKDSKFARVYKKTIKDFLVNLLKSSSEGCINENEESDNELDIWPEDLANEVWSKDESTNIDDGLFFVDTEPCDDKYIEIPKYSQNATLISDVTKEETPPEACKRRQICFNCDGEHQLRDCTLPRNHQRIAQKRKTMTTKMGRYHVEDDQKYGHLVPGRISGTLRNALGLKRYELPLYIYRMRLLGYPPGWLEEARISHSGITLFDSSGNATLDPDEEEGEVCEPGFKDKFDIKKILDFPGFNVPTSSRYIEEGHLFGIPPMSEQDSKMVMLQTLAPNAVKAYKRKKLLMFPSSNNNSLQGQGEMELDSGDETVVFPSNPPLPDDEPPPKVLPPPPPSSPPPLPPSSSPERKEKTNNFQNKTPNGKNNTSSNEKDKIISPNKNSSNIENKRFNESPKDKIKKCKGNKHSNDENVDSCSDIETIEVIQINDIPIPDDDLITIDEDYDSAVGSGRESPSLDDLEEKKRLLLNALKTDKPVSETIVLSESVETVESDTLDITEIDELLEMAEKEQREKMKKSDANNKKDITTEPKRVVVVEDNTLTNVEVEITATPKADQIVKSEQEGSTKSNCIDDGALSSKPSDVNTEVIKPDIHNKTPEESVSTPTTSNIQTNNIGKIVNTSDTKTGHVKTTQYGTPVINVASSYVKLPSEDKFAKDICDVINFENLPNSTGKFKQINSLLKKVKSVVDRIQDS